ncbi:sorting nexin-11 [Hippocampus zosterae]|uniref:sorting nexin-11 n=1 Tax=Hippocampus zosterae TaxID=109293 RepID=UPI00223E0DC7|nr:sorting nexin-11 [Hippocampus zosterae]
MNHEDEFVAVRVQDPRVQNEGSLNSYVDYKIFLHTNSRAFTAKTSCVRRRYSEFAWLKKKLQKNAGLVPVPDLPRKSFFSFSNEDFLERRRQGLQVFLDKVVNMTVCLSDSQLHLFLQTQLPVGHILDCVQGHTPYSVTDAILTYASSNRGWAQAQEEDAVIKEPSLNVSYESMESPAPHHPRPHNKDVSSPVLSSCVDDDTNEPCDTTAKATPAIFYLGDGLDERTPPEDATHESSRMETPVEVHSPGVEENRDEDAARLSSSNESIVKVSDEEDAVNPNCLAPNGFAKMSPEDDSRWPHVSGGTAADFQVNGSTDRELSNSLDINFAENDFSVLESSSAPELAGGKHSPLPD